MATAAAVKERPILFSGPMVRAILDGRKTQTRRIVKPQHIDCLETDDTGRFSFMHAPTCGGYCDYACASSGEVLEGHIGWTPWGSHPERRCNLWVRETFALSQYDQEADADPKNPEDWDCAVYRADGEEQGGGWTDAAGKKISPPWRPSIHMPRWASRITLEITDVRVERLQAITIDDIGAEGVQMPCTDDGLLIRVTGKNLITEYLPDGFFLDKTPLDKERIGMVVRANFASVWDSINGTGSWESNPFVWVIAFKRVS